MAKPGSVKELELDIPVHIFLYLTQRLQLLLHAIFLEGAFQELEMELPFEDPKENSKSDSLLIGSVHVLVSAMLVVQLQQVLQSQLGHKLIAKVLVVLEVRLETSFEALAHEINMGPVGTCEELLELRGRVLLLRIVVDLAEVHLRVEALAQIRNSGLLGEWRLGFRLL